MEAKSKQRPKLPQPKREALGTVAHLQKNQKLSAQEEASLALQLELSHQKAAILMHQHMAAARTRRGAPGGDDRRQRERRARPLGGGGEDGIVIGHHALLSSRPSSSVRPEHRRGA